MTRHAYERVDSGLWMPGVFEVAQNVPVGQAIDEILLLAECSAEGEYDGRILYLPLK